MYVYHSSAMVMCINYSMVDDGSGIKACFAEQDFL